MTELKTPGIIDSAAAQQAAQQSVAVVGEQGPLALGALPDEAMVALVGDAQQAGPLGEWYKGLDPAEKQLAQSAALRTMTAFDSFAVVAEHADGNHEYEVAEALLAALHLRRVDASLVAQRMTEDGQSWLTYRPVADGVVLRELVSPQGYHAFLLTPPDAQEQAEFLRFLGVTDDSAASGEERVVTESDLEGGQRLDFLRGITHVTTLARQLDDGGDLTVVHASASELFVAAPSGESVTYTPAGPQAVVDLWRGWAEGATS
ncbi:hypothetical protein [Janibacter sp. GS2]|uniref:hypothetical protein n=1 Tax=Janibacter sp. GS2 TaxID=3442646 RepID=UPI003EBFBFCF